MGFNLRATNPIMKLSLTPLLVLLFIALKSISQETKEIVEKSGTKWNKEKKVYSVLIDNNTVKQGAYQHYYNDKLVVSGFYKMDKKDSVWQRNTSRGVMVSKKMYAEGKRTGSWEFFNQDGSTALKYDFNTASFQTQQPDTLIVKYQAANGDWAIGKADRAPVWLRSKWEWFAYVNITLRYPVGAIDAQKSGVVLVGVLVDEEGNAIEYTIDKSVFPALDNESLRVVQQFQPEFLPAERDGKKVRSKVLVPMIFKMEAQG